MTAYNRSDLLPRAAASVLQETRVPIRLDIFDDASPDATEQVGREIESQDDRVTYVRRPVNVGSIPNFQQALATVSTEYFVVLADDDWFLPDFLHDAYQLLEASPDVDAAVFVTEHRDQDGNLLGTYPAAIDAVRFGRLEPREHLSDWMEHGHYMWSSILWRRNVLDTVGAPYMRTGLPSDVNFQAQIFTQHTAHLVDRVGAVFLAHPTQTSAGYDRSHITSWGKIFAGLDRAVRRTKVLDRDEYARLRPLMIDRYRPMWQAPAATRQSPLKRVGAAYVAATRLGDRAIAGLVLPLGRLRRR
jgi:glycosyltransferase involved in cell wall biosynthesis